MIQAAGDQRNSWLYMEGYLWKGWISADVSCGLQRPELWRRYWRQAY